MAGESKDIVVRSDSKIGNSHGEPSRGELTTRQQNAGGFLEKAFAHLPEEKQQFLIEKAVEARLKLDQQSEEGDRINTQSKDEMDFAVDHVQKLARTKTDFKSEHEGRTASGSWRTEITKSNATMTIIIVAIVGLALVLILAR